MIRKALIAGSLLVLPSITFAQGLNLSPIQSLLGAIARIVGALVPILVTLALVVFFWGLVRYLWGTGKKADIGGAKKLMGWGLVTLFVMVSVWGIIEIVQRAFNINENASARAPQILYPGAQSGYNSANPTSNWGGGSAAP